MKKSSRQAVVGILGGLATATVAVAALALGTGQLLHPHDPPTPQQTVSPNPQHKALWAAGDR
jgi:hypothetical protein